MNFSDLTIDAVLDSITEFDRLGRDEFLSKYGYRRARTYFLRRDEKLYDSKAIVGAAFGYLKDGTPLSADEFSGGEATVARVLRDLGFEVIQDEADETSSATVARNPPWIRDELLLALDLYFKNPTSPPGKNSKEVLDLSMLLNSLGDRLGRTTENKYRNPNGVYMKMMNFRRFDPEFRETGKVGLSRGNKLEGEIWNEFASDPRRLAEVAAAIRKAVDIDGQGEVDLDIDEEMEASEGKLLTRVHRTRERNRNLVDQKKKLALQQGERLACEVCSFDFQSRYGERGQGFIEAHHTKPVHTYSGTEMTKLSDLALVCANCHRMIHSSRPWLTIEELRMIIQR